MRGKLLIFILLTHLILVFSGCFRWKSDFTVIKPTLQATDVEQLFKKANDLANKADDAEKLSKAIAAFEKVLEADPYHYDALSYLATFYLLLGDGYTTDKSEKVKHFRSALGYSERAMYTNPEFKELIDQGAEVWDAVDTLTINEIDAMLFWTTAVFYYYKEGLGALGQMINFSWIKRAKHVLEKMTALEPEWGGGGIYFIWGIYYLSIPSSVGGDRKLSAEYFEKAIAAGPNWLLNRWGRGKYFHVKMQNPEQFKEDLQWVIDQDIKKANGPYAWKVYFINDARKMLNNIDDYF